jgi:polysaccharide biosynthesis transport protein
LRDQSDLRSLLAVFRRHWLTITLCVALACTAAVGVSLTKEKRYSASASLLFRDPGLDQKLFGSSYLPPSRDPDREAATNVQLVSLEVVADRAARRLGSGLDGPTVRRMIHVHSAGRSDVVAVTAEARDPRIAARLANVFADEYVGFRRDADRAKVREAEQLVESQLANVSGPDRNGAQARSLRERAEQLRVLAALQTGNAELVQRALPPTSPSSPKPIRSGALGLALGLLLGCVLALVRERLDRRLRDPEEIESALGLPVLASVPESRALRDPESGARALPAVEAESFFLLRAQLRYFNVDRDIRSVLITSASPQDGKSTVAFHLALAAARAGDGPVVLLEADLRRPTLAEQHGLARGPGLAELLTHDLALEDVAQAGAASEDPSQQLDVIVAGTTPPNPFELVESQRMDLLSERYAFVVVDTPPTVSVSDAIPLMRRVSGVIVVARLGKTTRDVAADLSRQLRNLHAPALGVVSNGVPLGRTGDYAYALPPTPQSASRSLT